MRGLVAFMRQGITRLDVIGLGSLARSIFARCFSA